MRKKYIYISLLISTGIYAIADYYCIYNFTFTLLFTIFLIFNLVNSVNTWNKNAAKGIDPEYDRTMGVKPFSGPYYAYKNTPGNLGAIGGLKINKKCNVLDIYQQPITGLYAAGLNAGGWIGSYYPGSGTAVGGVIHQGRRAAKSILGLE